MQKCDEKNERAPFTLSDLLLRVSAALQWCPIGGFNISVVGLSECA